MPAEPTKDNTASGSPGEFKEPERSRLVSHSDLIEAAEILEQGETLHHDAVVSHVPEPASNAERNVDLQVGDQMTPVPGSADSEPNQRDKPGKPAVKKPGLAKIFSLVFLFTIFSKFAGLARDIFVLSAYGAGLTSDAYNYAYLVTGNILVLFGGLGGPFHSSTVAVLTPRKQSPDMGKLTAQLLLWTALIMGLFSIAVYFAAPYIVPLALPGNAGDQKALWELTVHQLRIMLPMIVIAGLVGIGCGISNIYDEYFWPSMAPAVASVAIIIGVIGFRDEAGLCLGIATTVGAFGQLFVQGPGIMKARPSFFQLDLWRQMQPGTKEYLQMLWPAFITTGIGQLTVYVDMFFTSTLEQGGWTAIVNANKLVQLPLGVLLTAMLVPILPRFTEMVAAKKIEDLKSELRRALNLLWFLALPLSAILLALPGPIVQLLFKRGQFDEHAVVMFTTVLLFQVPSIFFYVARDLVIRVFFAHQDSKTPYNIAIFAIFAKFFLDWLLVMVFHLGIGGIALSTTIMTVFNLTLLSYLLRKKIGNLGATKLLKPISIMLSASALCGISSFFVYSTVYNALTPLSQSVSAALTNVAQSLPKMFHFLASAGLEQSLHLLVALGLASCVGLGLYVIFCQLCKLNETDEIARRLRSRFKKRAPN